MKAVAIAAACCVLLATAWGGVAAADVGTPAAPTGLAATACWKRLFVDSVNR